MDPDPNAKRFLDRRRGALAQFLKFAQQRQANAYRTLRFVLRSKRIAEFRTNTVADVVDDAASGIADASRAYRLEFQQ